MFKEFVKILIDKEEGGYVNHPNDRGGATKYGISLRFLDWHKIDINKDGRICHKDIKDLTIEDAEYIYKTYFWNPLYEKINDKSFSYKLFSTGVNIGVYTAIRKLQVILSRHNLYFGRIDGIFGSGTLRGVNAYIYKKSLQAAFIDELKEHYKAIAKKDPKQKVFLQGWLNRAEKRYDFS